MEFLLGFLFGTSLADHLHDLANIQWSFWVALATVSMAALSLLVMYFSIYQRVTYPLFLEIAKSMEKDYERLVVNESWQAKMSFVLASKKNIGIFVAKNFISLFVLFGLFWITVQLVSWLLPYIKLYPRSFVGGGLVVGSAGQLVYRLIQRPDLGSHNISGG